MITYIVLWCCSVVSSYWRNAADRVFVLAISLRLCNYGLFMVAEEDERTSRAAAAVHS